jgi:two-component system response regulator NreC
MLQNIPDLTVVGEAENGIVLLSLVSELNPDIVLMDISMPGLSGIEATRQLRKIAPHTRVLALTVHEDEGMLREMIRAGAHGYIIKRAIESELIQAIRIVAQGYIYVYPSLTGALLQDLSPHSRPAKPSHEMLTLRETDVLLLLVRGYTNRQIAEELNLSQRTIEGHRSSLVSKLGMKSRVELMNYAEEQGLIDRRTKKGT